MTAIALDTYEAVKTLQAAGFQEDQAQAIVALVKQGSDIAQDLVTNKELEGKLRSLEERMVARIDTRMTILEQRLTIRLGLMMFVAVGLSVGIARLLA